MQPDVRYAPRGGVAIAYQVVGDGETDLVFVPAASGEVLVSQTVKDLVAGSGLHFEERGGHKLKGIPGTWRLYGVSVGADVAKEVLVR